MINILKENLKFLKQTMKLSVSDLIKTYKGSALGPIWSIAKPTFFILIYWFAFKVGIKNAKNIEGYPFVIWLVCGYLPWTYMSDCISNGSGAIRSNKHLVTKMPFPVSTIMTFVNLSKLYVHLMLLGVVIIFLLLTGNPINIYWIQLFFYIPFMFLYFTALCWITAPLSAISKDFQSLVKSLMTGLFWLSGVLWDPYSMKPGVAQAIILMNPITYFLTGYRNSLILHKWFFQTPYETVSFFIVFCSTLLLGSTVYLRLKKSIVDVL